MLHEVLVVLNGQASGFIGKDANEQLDPYIHKTEQVLLKRVCEVGELNRGIQTGVGEIGKKLTKYHTTTHGCVKCIQDNVIDPFERDLVDLEKRILTNDKDLVAGDNMVSLSMIIGEICVKWERRFKYCMALVDYLRIHKITTKTLYERLTKDSMTGYSDLKELTTNLLKAVERNWLAQLKSWLGYGKINRLNEDDFFIKSPAPGSFEVVHDLVPTGLLSEKAIADAFLIGKSINLMKGNENSSNVVAIDLEAGTIEKTVGTLKERIYEDIIKSSMPVEKMLLFFSVLKTFLLLDSPEFTAGLQERASNVLAHSLACYLEDSADPTEERQEKYALAKSILNLKTIAQGDEFSDFVLNVHSRMEIDLEWPFNIFLGPVDANTYSFLFHYLFALQFTRARLLSAWRETKNLDRSHTDLMHALFQAKLFIDIVYSYVQNSIINANFQSFILDYLATSHVQIDQVIQNQSDFLATSCQEIFIDNEQFRKTMRSFLLSCSVLAETINTTRSHLLSQKDATISQMSASMYSLVQLMEETNQSYSDKLNTLLLQLEGVLEK